MTINDPKPIRVDNPLELPSIMKVEDVPKFLYQHHLRVVRRWWESSRNLMVIEVEEAAGTADISTEIERVKLEGGER